MEKLFSAIFLFKIHGKIILKYAGHSSCKLVRVETNVYICKDNNNEYINRNIPVTYTSIYIYSIEKKNIFSL